MEIILAWEFCWLFISFPLDEGRKEYQGISLLRDKAEQFGLIPKIFFLSQNHPNPFKDKTKIKYCVAYKTRVVLTVYNQKGKLIYKLVDEELKPGTYEVEFCAAYCYSSVEISDESRKLSDSVEVPQEVILLCRLEAGNYKCEKKMIMIK